MPSARVPRIPLRTLLLMIVALVAFGRLWCATHPTTPSAERRRVPEDDTGQVVVVPVPRPVMRPDAGQR